MAISLSEAQDRLFNKVAQLVSVNPFSQQRVDIDQALLPKPSSNYWERLQQISALVEAELYLGDQDRASEIKALVREYSHVKYSVLLYIYVQFYEAFDAYILAQVKSGSRYYSLTFLDKIMGEFQTFGFDRSSSSHYTALFFQMRRAFHFIDQGLVGYSQAMQDLRSSLWTVIFSHDLVQYESNLLSQMAHFPVLLLGETGVGKGVAARAIGRSLFIPLDPDTGQFKANFMDVFVSVNLSELSESINESELFGHKAGAFTDASQDYDGIFGLSSPYGAIFLDEIGELPLPIQVKLLRVLQERTYYPVGSKVAQRCHGRFISATNRSLDELLSGDLLRSDFFYRISALVVNLPSLRDLLVQNQDDLKVLIQHTLNEIMGQFQPVLGTDIFLAIVSASPQGYAWPGNVRELERYIKQWLIQGDILMPQSQGVASELIQTSSLTASQLLSAYAHRLYQDHGSYQDVAAIMDIDWRTAKAYIVEAGR
ncbi:MAG: Fis family transcriptional regulator [Actinobacteria bacterium]|nr:Fis family transcriptional regulator [Actinomycetota bacterium]